MSTRVVVTAMSGISPLGCDWKSVSDRLKKKQGAVRFMKEWSEVEGLNSLLACKAAPYELPKELYTRKATRSMSPVSLMACRTAELALRSAGLYEEDWIHNGSVGIAYGSCAGSAEATIELGQILSQRSTRKLNATTYLRFMSHTAAVNMAVFFKLRGRIIPTSSACTSSSQALGYAYEAIKYGKARAMLAGGAEEGSLAHTAVFDTLLATSTHFNDRPELSPRPFDAQRDGLVLGEGACTFVLESLESALERGAHIYAELVGFATNCDGDHVTKPSSGQMATVMRMALEDAGISPDEIGYINAHGTATRRGDAAESQATYDVFGSKVPVASLKGYMGHTLGACGALEAWMSIEMMNGGWFAPNHNLDNPAADCADLFYIRGDGLKKNCRYVMTNNFAFGGINTSLIFKRWEK